MTKDQAGSPRTAELAPVLHAVSNELQLLLPAWTDRRRVSKPGQGGKDKGTLRHLPRDTALVVLPTEEDSVIRDGNQRQHGEQLWILIGVRLLESLGYAYHDDEWAYAVEPASAVGEPLPFTTEADALHGALMWRADAFGRLDREFAGGGRVEVNCRGAYELKRRPLGRDPNVPRGKG